MSARLQYERFFWFHGRIRAAGYPNAPHLAREFGVSPRTAQRDIEFMRDRFQAPLVYDYRKKGYRYSDDSFELPGHWISETNVLALAFAVRLASTIPDPSLKNDLCRLIGRVTGATDKRGKSCLHRVTEKISVKNIEYAQVDTATFRRAAEALFDDRALSITYHSPHTNDTSSRTIQPLHLMHYMGSWHLLAWCAHRGQIRDFAMARIREIAPAAETIHLPADLPPIKELTRRHFGIMQGDETAAVTLRFTAKIAPRIAEQIWHPQQQSRTEADGGLLLTFPAADFRKLAGIVLSHGAEVQVVEPVELQNLVREEIDRMSKIYFPL